MPAYGEDFGYTLDLMRHLPDAPNGMTEFLIAQTALALGADGISRLSMNFAMWGRLYEEDVALHAAAAAGQARRRRDEPVLPDQVAARLQRQVLARSGSRGCSSYQEPTDLPRVGLLYAGAEGFLAIPGIGDLFVPRAVGGATAETTAA